MNAAPLKPQTRRWRSGLTLVELVVVLVILVALASMIIPRADIAAEQSRIDATNETLRRLRDVILNRYVPDTNGAGFTGTTFLNTAGDHSINDGMPRLGSVNMPPQLVCLFLNPGLQPYNTTTHFGWNGPYLTSGTGVYPGSNPSTAALRGFLASGTTSAFGTAATAASGSVAAYPGDPTVLDAWGNPIVIVPIHDQSYGQFYYALISAGPSGTLGSGVQAYAASALTGTSGGGFANALAATITVDTTGQLTTSTTSGTTTTTNSTPTAGISGMAATGARILNITNTSGTTEFYPYWQPLQ